MRRLTGTLFVPPRPPLVLDGERDFVLGRGASCDLTLDSLQVSRSHAAVRVDGDRCLLRDLGSTNGTHVNGEPVRGERELKAGDRIAVGDVEVTFCRVDASMAEAAAREPARERTVVMAAAAAGGGEAITGTFSQLPPFAVLQMLELGGQSGCLTVHSAGGPGSIWFVDGQPRHAKAGERLGFDAAVALCKLSAGRFRFEPDAEAPEATIDASVTHVLLEASRQADEHLAQ